MGQGSNVVVVSEVRLRRGGDGSIRCPSGTRDYAFWARYLDAFDTVTVVARVSEHLVADGSLVEGNGVRVHAVPDFGGGAGLVSKYRMVSRRLREVCAVDGDAYVLRVPGALANLTANILEGQARPFAVEVVGDPYDVFAPGVVRHPLRPLVRRWMTRSLRRQCQYAVAAAYVTESTLQRRYPPSSSAFTTHYSSVELLPDAFVSEPRVDERIRSTPPYSVVGVGRLSQSYKGADVLLEALALCRKRGLDVGLTWLGDGRIRPQLEQQALTLGLGDRCRFVGDVPAGRAVRAYLDDADLLVLPSRTEGLPRALIEAMARGLPCIGSAVGGIPELLEPSELVRPDDPETLADLMVGTLQDPALRTRMSERNLRKAARYSDQALRSRRRVFYEVVRDRTCNHYRAVATPDSSQV